MFYRIIMRIPVPDYGQLVKIRENGRVVRKEKMTIYSNLDPGDIETTDVENYNGILIKDWRITCGHGTNFSISN